MHCPVTLTALEFRDLHNAICSLNSNTDPEVVNAVARMRDALQGAYAQESEDFDRKSEHYGQVAQTRGLLATWSLYEVADLNQPHPYTNVLQVCYRDHWGNKPVFVPVEGATWADLYAAADQAISLSGDRHHTFIENFRVNPKDPRQLVMTTGS